jgi:hypothetical protein
MNIEFRKHQLVVAGLSQQIELLNQRCVEHRQNFDTAKRIYAEALQQRDARIDDLTAQCNRVLDNSESDLRVIAAQNDQLAAIARCATFDCSQPRPEVPCGALLAVEALRGNYTELLEASKKKRRFFRRK